MATLNLGLNIFGLRLLLLHYTATDITLSRVGRSHKGWRRFSCHAFTHSLNIYLKARRVLEASLKVRGYMKRVLIGSKYQQPRQNAFTRLEENRLKALMHDKTKTMKTQFH